jgi:hypothetical protein
LHKQEGVYVPLQEHFGSCVESKVLAVALVSFQRLCLGRTYASSISSMASSTPLCASVARLAYVREILGCTLCRFDLLNDDRAGRRVCIWRAWIEGLESRDAVRLNWERHV